MSICIYYMKKISSFSGALYKGLTTGLCGSITTYSSWIITAVDTLFTSDTWIYTFVMIFMEFMMTWSAFSLGFLTARYLDDYHRSSVVYKIYLELLESGKTTMFAVDDLEESKEMKAAGRIAPLTGIVSSNKNQVERNDTLTQTLLNGSTASQTFEIENPLVTTFASSSPDQPMDVPLSSTASDKADIFPRSQQGSFRAVRSEKPLPPSPHQLFLQYEYYLWAFLFILVAIPLWVAVGFIPATSFYDQNRGNNVESNRARITLFRSVILAPFGAWLRWGLAKLPRIKALWPSMNPQTMAANLIAVVLAVSLNTFASSEPWTEPISDGICGSLSTVSTFFAELRTLYMTDIGECAPPAKEDKKINKFNWSAAFVLSIGGPILAVRYCLVTFGLSIFIVQIVIDIGNQFGRGRSD